MDKNKIDQNLLNFLDKDYERKVNYLIQQFNRMWTRFNFFITIESSLIGGKFLFKPDVPDKWFAILGTALSLCWYVFGANDKYLVNIYKAAVKEASEKLMVVILLLGDSYRANEYKYIGNSDAVYPDVNKGTWRILSWRVKYISITNLASLFPLLLTIAWLVYLVKVIV